MEADTGLMSRTFRIPDALDPTGLIREYGIIDAAVAEHCIRQDAWMKLSDPPGEYHVLTGDVIEALVDAVTELRERDWQIATICDRILTDVTVHPLTNAATLERLWLSPYSDAVANPFARHLNTPVDVLDEITDNMIRLPAGDPAPHAVLRRGRGKPPREECISSVGVIGLLQHPSLSAVSAEKWARLVAGEPGVKFRHKMPMDRADLVRRYATEIVTSLDWQDKYGISDTTRARLLVLVASS